MYYYFRAVETLLTVFWRACGKEEGKGKRDKEEGKGRLRMVLGGNGEDQEWKWGFDRADQVR